MEKIELGTPDITEENIDRLGELFPSVLTEVEDEDGGIKKAVDFDALRELLGDVAEGSRMRYQFTWPGKDSSRALAWQASHKTLRPIPEKSVGWPDTNNLFIEGDNLEALKLLRQAYAGRVRMIYVDPPYNTGHDLLYNDDYSLTLSDYSAENGDYDDEGGRLVRNLETNGKFHTDWCSMIYPRLIVGRDLLSSDGIFFLNIGEDELDNALKICDEVFSRNNRITIFSRAMKLGGAKGKFYTPSVDYILAYARNKTSAQYFRAPFTQEQISVFYKQRETDGPHKGELYGEERLFKASLDPRPNQRYYIQCPDGSFVIPPGVSFPKQLEEGLTVLPTAEDKVWKWIYSRYKSELDAGRIVFKKTGTSSLVDENGNPSPWNIYNKLYLSEQQDKGVVPSNLITRFENRQSSKELKELGIPFDYAKPVGLISYLEDLVGLKSSDIVLDFFAGSATTAHATMLRNLQQGTKCRFIMVQYPEECDPDETEAGKAGYVDICQIGESRIRAAGKKIVDEGNANVSNSLFDTSDHQLPDIGFRVLRIDSSNMTDTYATPDETQQENLLDLIDNVKDDRSDLDLLFEVLPKFSLPYSAEIEEIALAGKKCFSVEGGVLVACFDSNVGVETIEEIARMKPVYAVVRDASLVDDATEANFEELFKTYSPSTERLVL